METDRANDPQKKGMGIKMNTTKERQDEKVLLVSDTVKVKGYRPRYYLWRDAGNYRVEVQLGREWAEEDLGGDLTFAADCYRAIRKGGVTPCALSDVVEELRKRKNL